MNKFLTYMTIIPNTFLRMIVSPSIGTGFSRYTLLNADKNKFERKENLIKKLKQIVDSWEKGEFEGIRNDSISRNILFLDSPA